MAMARTAGISHHRPAGRSQRSCRGLQHGLTLMELLVALVLVAMLGTMMVQGVAFFGGIR